MPRALRFLIESILTYIALLFLRNYCFGAHSPCPETYATLALEIFNVTRILLSIQEFTNAYVFATAMFMVGGTSASLVQYSR